MYVCVCAVCHCVCMRFQSSGIISQYCGFSCHHWGQQEPGRTTNHRATGTTRADERKPVPGRFCRSHDTALILKCSHERCYANDLLKTSWCLSNHVAPSMVTGGRAAERKNHTDADRWMGRDDRLNGFWMCINAHMREQTLVLNLYTQGHVLCPVKTLTFDSVNTQICTVVCFCL